MGEPALEGFPSRFGLSSGRRAERQNLSSIGREGNRRQKYGTVQGSEEIGEVQRVVLILLITRVLLIRLLVLLSLIELFIPRVIMEGKFLCGIFPGFSCG